MKHLGNITVYKRHMGKKLVQDKDSREFFVLNTKGDIEMCLGNQSQKALAKWYSLWKKHK
jgi:hypothetical protein